MAKFNEILVGRFNRALQKLTGIKGIAPTPQLGSEIMPVIPLFFGVEERYPESWNRFSAFALVTGGAAQNAGFRFRIPGSTNVVCVIEKLNFNFSTAATFKVRVDPTQATTDLTPIATSGITSLDARGPQQPNAILSTSTNFGALTQNFPSANAPAGTTVDLILTIEQEITLIGTPASNGAMLNVVDNSAADNLIVGVVWRERLLEEGERL